MRRKLLRHLSGQARAQGASDDSPVADEAHGPERIDALLDWLEAEKYLSRERFGESRVRVRAARYGNLRIRQELQQHEITLDDAAAQALAQSELERARALAARRFAAPAADLAERARQARFLIGRGFSHEVVRQVTRATADDEKDAGAGRGAPDRC